MVQISTKNLFATLAAYLTLVILLLFSNKVLATTYSFTGSGNWSIAGNWDANGIPPNPLLAGDVISINGSAAMDVNQSLNAGSQFVLQWFMTLSINSGFTLTNNGDLTISTFSILTNFGTVINNSNLSVNGGGSFDNKNYLEINTGALLTNFQSLTNSGTLNINSGGLLDNKHWIINEPGGILNNNAGGTLNSGSIQNQPGATLNNNNDATMNIGGSVFNYTGATMHLYGSINITGWLVNEVGNTLENNAFIIIHYPGNINNHGMLINNNYINNYAGQIYNYPSATITNNGTLINYHPYYSNIINFGTIINNFGATMDNGGTIQGESTIVQSGTLTNTGYLSPGPPIYTTNPGKFTFTGPVNLGTGTYSCGISGTGQGTGYDWIAVSDVATLTDATLNVQWGFTPLAGQTFMVMTYGSHVGEFATVNIPPVSGLIINTSYTPTAFIISVVSPCTDTDSDGICDNEDNCPSTPNANQADIDNDGYGDVCDGCPNDVNKSAPGVCGCGVADTDTDGDGTADCNDGCPLDPDKTAPGICGCGVADTDTDGDGTADCNDGCPLDPNKTAPGICGCGVADADTDGDGTADCNDGCPLDPNKTAPGICGCGVADADTDGDGTADCNDGCPLDANKTAPGQCGCGVADTDSDCDGVADCHDVCPGGDDSVDNIHDGIPDCSQLLNYASYSNAWKCGENKIKVCHAGSTNCINKNALSVHYNHGDNIGPCTSCAQNMNTPGNASTFADHPGIEVFPNPSNNEVSIYLHGMAGATELAIYDQLGKLVWRQQMEEGQQLVSLDLMEAHFMNGIYFVHATSVGQRLTQRLVVEK